MIKNDGLIEIPKAHIPVWGEYISREELSRLLKVCFRKFYFRPTKVAKNLFTMKSFGEFKIKLKGLLTILGHGGFSRNEAT